MGFEFLGYVIDIIIRIFKAWGEQLYAVIN
jgi:hypothetical protein